MLSIIADGRPLPGDVVDMGNGQLLFPYVTKVSSRTQLTDNIYNVINFNTKSESYDMAKRFLFRRIKVNTSVERTMELALDKKRWSSCTYKEVF